MAAVEHPRRFYYVMTSMFSASMSVLRQMCKQYNEYIFPMSARVAVGTYNVNGGKHFRSVVYKDLSLSDWLLDAPQIARSHCKYLL